MSVITGDQNMSTISIEGLSAQRGRRTWPRGSISVSPGYFPTMGIPLFAGRDFSLRDRTGAPRVAVVNDVFANYYFRTKTPSAGASVSRRGRQELTSKSSAWCAAPSTPKSMRRSPREVYLAFAQDENPSSLVVYARTSGDPKTVFTSLRREVNGLDSGPPHHRPAHHGRSDRRVALRAARDGRTLGLLRHSRHAARRHRAIRRHGVHGHAAHARNRHPPGAGRRIAPACSKLVLREVAMLTVAGVADRNSGGARRSLAWCAPNFTASCPTIR